MGKLNQLVYHNMQTQTLGLAMVRQVLYYRAPTTGHLQIQLLMVYTTKWANSTKWDIIG
jgi:hypothetical protein